MLYTLPLYEVYCTHFLLFPEMKTRILFILVVCLLILDSMGSQEVAGVSTAQKGSTFLQDAIRNLINYTAIEVEARLDMNDIAGTVAAIAYQKVTAELGE